MKTTVSPAIVLAGCESSGKSALFRGLTGHMTGDEANFRGSTVLCRKCHVRECQCDVVDTPGIRAQSDSETTRLALHEISAADVVLLVARGTDLQSEIEALLGELALHGRRTALAVTFADKAPEEVERLAAHYRRQLAVPVVALNARDLAPAKRRELLQAIAAAAAPSTLAPSAPPAARVAQPQRTAFEHPLLGPVLAVAAILLMFGLPVYLAYALASWAQPLVDASVIEPAKAWLQPWLSPLAGSLLTGNYGLLTLGWYSFLWAFPVVVLISASVAACEETGLHDRITRALDPLLRRAGLSGRDLLPVLTGFGCNVVAVFQSRGCSACARKSCVSMIAFGSACSYQIGASLSLFGSSGHPGLFLPYLAGLFLVGALHTRLWHGARAAAVAAPMARRAFLQHPRLQPLLWRVRAVLKQFLGQAMPIFLLICLVSAFLAHFGIMDVLSRAAAPALAAFRLPAEAAPGVVFSILRKDGLLTLNQGEGALLASLSAGQVFTLVWLAGTLTACLVTLWTIRREMGWKTALSLAGKQAATSLVSTAMIAWGVSLL